MARRKQLWHDGATREKIQTTQLVKRLQAHINGEIELSATQVRGIEILLRKTLADLAQTTLEGGQTPITQRFVTGVPRPQDYAQAPVMPLIPPANGHSNDDTDPPLN